MKTRIYFLLIAMMVMPLSRIKAQQEPEQLNMPGDNLNLYAVMKLFQESETLEIFEKTLNEQDARINNLDLNGDNYIDYIKVTDYVEKSIHYIVLQVAVSSTENQDVAVFVVKKDPNGKVQIQLVGDEALYGKYYIVEPYYDTDPKSTPNPGYYGNYNAQNEVVYRTTYYEVASWPVIRYIFLPTYIAWHSPWYWGYYPVYWSPWTPWYWHQYYGYHYHWHHHYYSHFHHGNHHHFDGWDEGYYGPRHTTSVTVQNRLNRGDYTATYSKPETIRDGSAYFKTKHPEMVTKDMRDPEVKDIRTAAPGDRQNQMDKASQRNNTDVRNNNQGVPKPNVNPSNNDRNNSTSSPGNVKENRKDNKTPGTRNDPAPKVKNKEPKSSGNHGDRVKSQPAQEKPKTGRTEPSKSDGGKTGRK